ncbi:MAG: DUF3617 domain-containing protein [Deltaproteobacteria bacterium]|nr:DUF3617 domain-containing protein [Deltaproteobacteria bacterium]
MRYSILFVALLTISSTASAATFDSPKRKSGLWEIRITSAEAGGTHTIQQCVNEKTDDLMKNDMDGMEKSACSKSTLRKEGDKFVHESVCKVEGSTAKTRAVISGRFDSAYRVDTKSNYEPPMQGMRESSMKMDAKWLGPCKAGQKPGDVVMPGMPNINMDEIMKNMPKKP